MGLSCNLADADLRLDGCRTSACRVSPNVSCDSCKHREVRRRIISSDGDLYDGGMVLAIL